MRRRLWTLALLFPLSCTSEGSGGEGGLQPLPPLSAAPLVTEQTVRLKHAVSVERELSPGDPETLQSLLKEGWGETEMGAGVDLATHTLDGSPPPGPGPSPRLVTRFVHLADTQLADDESPSRMVNFDSMGSTAGAYRPQEAWGCRMLNAATRTINKLHETKPLEFVLLGGDNADNNQTNEIDWFQAILDGSPSVKCDSGSADDPVPGPNNDPKDAFFAEGLRMPWRWVTGNHDVLNQGNFPVDDALRAVYLGTSAKDGTRDWSKPGAPVTTGPVVADPQRAALSRVALMNKVASAGDGHGIPEEVRQSGKAFYSFDVEGGGLRIVVLDTAANSGGSDGLLHRSDLEAFVRPTLEKAERDGVYVILVSHHGTPTLTDGGGFGGKKQDDAVLPDEWRTFLGGFPHVVLHLGAHTHMFRVGVAQPESGHHYFEAETAALLDWPGEVRMFEVWDQDNDFLLIRAIPLDYSTENDEVAKEARRRSAIDFTTGWTSPTIGPGAPDAQAVELWFPKVTK